MVRQYYVPQITEISEQELQSIFDATKPPVCLLGGWAVHLHVNPGFSDTHGREYIGSRDIDLGIYINPDWTTTQVKENNIGETLHTIEELGYSRSRFGFVQPFSHDTGERLSEEEARNRPQHELFEVYIDLIPDTTELDTFQEAFGFTPPAETLLKPVFNEDLGEPLSDLVSWDAEDAQIVPPELLGAMKVRSLPDRDKSHKQVKDIADLHALLWYIKDYNQIKDQVHKIVSDTDLNRLQSAVTEEGINAAANLLQIEPSIIRDSIQRLYQ
jgi:hypothetical protein